MAADVEVRARERPDRGGLVGRHVRRLDARQKVDGSIEFTDDLPFEGFHAAIHRSTVAHGVIESIDASAAEGRPGVRAVVTGADLEAADWIDPVVGPAIRDQPLLAAGKARYVGEPVAAVVAESRAIARDAVGDIHVEYDRLPVADGVDAALGPDAPRLHDTRTVSAVFDDIRAIHGTDEPNVAYEYRFEHGDVDAGFAAADVVVEGTYATPMAQHVHLDPFVTIADYDAGTDSVRILSGNQTPHFARQEVARVFDLPRSKVEVEVPQMGGSYGSKTYVRLEPLVAALSRAVDAPVKLRLASDEAFDTAVRDGSHTRVRTGATADGRIVAQAVEIDWDAGAYADISPRKAKKAGYTAPGAYDVENVSVRSTCVYTNKPPGVPYRGFGVSQSAWAVESHLDRVAAEVDMDPLELRLANVVQDDGTYNGAPIGNTGVGACLRSAADEAGWVEDTVEQPAEPHLRRGRGLAVILKATITPSTSEAIAHLDADGSLTVLTGSTKVGQGVQTTLAQLAADELGIPLGDVSLHRPNTAVSPFNTSTTSSRTTFHMGNAIAAAIGDIADQAVAFVAAERGVDPDTLEVVDGAVTDGDETLPLGDVVERRFAGGGGTLVGTGYYSTAKSEHDDEYPSAFWMSGATVAEVTVDVETGAYSVDRWVNSTDAGTAVDPERVRGQILGAATQGLGHVRSEAMAFDRGQQVNKTLLDYKVPAIEDVPDPDASAEVIVESHDPGGPRGAKGVGEANTTTVPPAVANAIADATGARVTELPVTPERVLRALRGDGEVAG